MIKYLVLFSSCVAFLNTQAQEFTISGEFKPRAEYRKGYGRLRAANDSLDMAASFITQRSRINFNYNDVKQKLKVGAVIQDVRNWGSTEPQNIGDKNTLDLHEFWVEFALGAKLALKAGRHELNYDNARVIGNADWAQQARSFDAALLKYDDAKAKLQFHAGFGINSKSETLTRDVYDVSNYKYMHLLWLNKKFKNLNTSILFLNNGLEFTVNKSLPVTAANRKTAFSQTIGGRLEYTQTKFTVNTEGYYQGGKDGSNTPLRAWNLGADLVCKAFSTLSFVPGFEILSGTAMNETDGMNHSFSPLYGTNHKFNGFMDYFYVGGRLTKTGLEDYYFSIKYKKKKLNIDLTPHLFYSHANIVQSGDKRDEYLAFETDLSAGYKLSDIVLVQGGLSFLKGSSSLEYLIPGGDKAKLNTWAWSQIVVKPKFLSVSK